MAFLLGATNKDEKASHLLPVVSEAGGAPKLTFKCLNAAKRGSWVLKLQYSRDLGITDLWSNHDDAVAPGNAPLTTTIGGVDFVTSVVDGNLNQVEATIPASAAASGISLFGRLQATPLIIPDRLIRFSPQMANLHAIHALFSRLNHCHAL